MKKRLFAGLLALCMTVNLMSATAFAEEASNEPAVECTTPEKCVDGVHGDDCAITVDAAKKAEEAAKAKCLAKCGEAPETHLEGCDFWTEPETTTDETKPVEETKNVAVSRTAVMPASDEPEEPGSTTPVAEINGKTYNSLVDANNAAKAGDTIVLLNTAEVGGELTLKPGITLDGNDKQINGSIVAGGNLTFEGHTKVTSFNAGYNKPIITIGEGACLEMNGTGRMVIGHGATFNITGSIEDAKNADKSKLTPSLIMPGASFTGNGVTFNVTNAYVKVPSSYSSSSSSASGTFNFNITNSIWESAGKLSFEAQSVAATVNFELKNSVLTTGSHLLFSVSEGEVVIDNSNVNVGLRNQIENRSTMTIKNGSVVYGAVATSSNAINPGTLIVENATYDVTGEFSGSGLGTGILILKKGADFTAGKITKANIIIDATDMNVGDFVNINGTDLSKIEGTIAVLNDAAGFEVGEGKITINEKYVAKVGETGYETLEAAFKSVTTENNVVEILSDVVIDEYWDARNTGSKFTVPVTINGNGHTIKFENTVYDGGNHMAAFRFESDAIVNDLKIDMSNALSGFATRIRAISSKADLTVNNCTFIGNGPENNTRAIIFGESALEAIGEVDVVVTNSTFKNWRRGVSDNENYQDAKNVNVTKCTFENSDVYVSAKGKVTVNNNEFLNSGVDIRSYSSNTALNAVAKENILDADMVYNVQDFAEADVQDGFVISAVAKIGNKFYGTLSTALKAAQSGDTVTVLKDVTEIITIPAGKNLTLDLNGFVISSNDDTINVKDDNTVLTITDSSVAKTGKVVSDGNYRGALYVRNGKVVIESGTFEGVNNEKCYAAYVSVDGTLVVNGGTLKALGNGSAWGVIACGSDSITFDDGEIISNGIGISGNGSDNYEAPITINGGTITAETMGIYFPADSELTITDGTIQGATAVYFKSGNLTITGGEFIANGQKVDYAYAASGSNATGDAIVIENVGAEGYQAIGKVSITGGTFTSINAKAIGSYTAGKGEEAVTGFITGGTFNTNPSAYVATGYESVAKESNYLVGKHELKAVAGKSPSCTSTGIKDHYKCDFCGRTYSDAAGKTLLTDLVASAKGHKMEGTGSDSGYHWSVCTRCGATGSRSSHSYSNGKCSCGHTVKVEVYVPETPAPAPTTPAPTTTTTQTTTQTTTTTKPVEEAAKPVETPVEEVVVDTKIVEEVASEEVKEAVKETVTVAETKEVEKETGTVTEVKVAVTTETVDKVIENTEAGATVILPLTEVAEEGQAVTEAEVAVEALEKIVEAEAALTVEFEGVKVTFESETIKAIAEQAKGSTIELRVVPVEHHELNEEQQAVLEEHDVAVRVSAQIFSDGEYIGDFKGGKARIAIPFTPEEGKAAEDHKVYFVDDNGEMTLMPAVYVDGHMVFETNHFSDYVIVYEEVAEVEEEAAVEEEAVVETVEEETEKAGLPIVPIIIIVVAIILVVAFVATRKRNDEE